MKGKFLKKAAALTIAAMLVTGSVPMQPIADMARELSVTASATTYVSYSHNGRCSSVSAGDYFELNAELYNDTGNVVYIRCIDDATENTNLSNGEGHYANTDYTIVFKEGNVIYTRTGRSEWLTNLPGGDYYFAYNGSDHALLSSQGRASGGTPLQYAVSTSLTSAPTSWTTDINSSILKRSAQETYYIWVKMADGLTPFVIRTVSVTTETSAVFLYGNGNSPSTAYVIRNENSWNFMCDALRNNDTFNHFSGKYFKLADDITVTKMAGDNSHPFEGTFNGQGNTLTFRADASDNYVAPFAYLNGTASAPATISNLDVNTTITANGYRHIAGLVALHQGSVNITNCTVNVTLNASVGGDNPSDLYPSGLVSQSNGILNISGCTVTGSISTNGKYAAGYIGVSQGTVNIENSVSSVTINSSTAISDGNGNLNKDGTHSGFIAAQQQSSPVTIKGCVFNGKLLSTNGTIKCAGFIGWRSNGANIYDSIFAPAEVTIGSDGSATFARNAVDTYNCYYTYPFYNSSYDPSYAPYDPKDSSHPDKYNNGKQAHSVTAGDNVTISSYGTAEDTYNVSKITSYGTGLLYNNKFYAGKDESVSLTLGHNTPTGYTFNGYTINAGTLSGYTLTMPDQDVVISADNTINKYTVTWKNDDGSILRTDTNVEYGTTPSYGTDPTKQGNAQYSYTFAGWSPAVTTVTGDATYTAQFTESVNKYTVTWKNDDGSILRTDTNVEYGTTPSYGTDPTKQGNAQYSYTFAGWSPAVTAVTGNATYTAQFTESVNKYTVTWKNDDGSILRTDTNVEYGTTPSYGTDPTKQGNAQYSYTFAGWSPAVTTVTGNATYTAQFTEITNKYTVTWKNEDGSVLRTDTDVEYGTTPSYGTDPTKAGDEFYSYSFTGWTPAVSSVTGNAEYTAQFSRELLPDHFSQSDENTYVIHDARGWEIFCTLLNDADYSCFSGKTVELENDISVTAAAGTSEKPFKGTFDGCGKTLTVTIEDTSNQGTAPFRYIEDGAVIKNLTVTGTVTGTTHAAGLVGFSKGGSSEAPNTIDNCTVNTNVTVPATNGNRHMGGVVGHGLTSCLKIKDTVFGGSMTNTGNYAGGLQGWSDGNTLIIENCLVKGSYSGGGLFHPIAIRNTGNVMTKTINGAYYTTDPTLTDEALIAEAGTKVYSSAPSGAITETVNAPDGEVYYIITGYQSYTDIRTADDWNLFVQSVEDGNSYAGVTVTLGADITVTTMAGTSDHPFKGTFNGGAHTLTLDLTSTGEYCAPFRFVDGATIYFLNTAGTVNAGSNKFGTGLIGQSSGTVNIKSCRSSVSISSTREGDGTHSGFIGVADGAVNFTNCLFDGTISGSTTINCGGFVGWRNNTVNITNCLMAGTLSLSSNDGSATFSRGSSTLNVNNSYYRTSYGTVQGTAVGSKTNEQLAAALGRAWTVSGNDVVPIMDMTNIRTADLTGVEPLYNETGSVIPITPVLTALDGTVLTENTHYTKTLTKGGETVSEVKSPAEYTFTFTAVDGGGYCGSYSVKFTVIVAAPTNVKQTAYSGTTAVLSWNQTGTADSWVVEYDTDSSFTNAESVTANTTSVAFSGLTNETTYFVRVKAVLGMAESAWTGTQNVYTTDKVWLGIGATDSYNTIPFNNYYNYSLTEQIYTAEELGSEEKLITAIDFMKVSDIGCERNIDIYMVHTDKNSFASGSSWINVTAEDKVFSGTVNFAYNNWTTITLDIGFLYNGTQNVAVVIDDNTGSYKGNTYFAAYNKSVKPAIYISSDNTNYDPTAASSLTGSYPSFINAVRFTTVDEHVITVDDSIEHGSITASCVKAGKGKTVIVTPTADEGYFCSSVTVNDGSVAAVRNNDGTFSFTMPDQDVTVTAEFVVPYDVTVTWKNYDGSTIKTDSMLIGSTPEYIGDEPTRPNDDFYSYTFKGWDKELTKVYGDTEYTAEYSKTPLETISLTVCDSTDTYYNIPYKSDMNKDPTGTNQVYPASMLTALKDKTLWSMKLYARDDYTIDVKGLKIYLAEVDFTTFADKFAKAENGVVNLYDVSGTTIGSTFTATNFTAVKVFDHDYDFKQGENLIDFDTPYEYGGGNLLVIIENTDFGTNSNAMYFYAKDIGSNVSRYRYQRGYSYSTSYLAKCTFGYVDENYYTVTWKGTDGTTLETDTGMIFGEMPEYGGTLPEGTEDDFYTYTYEWDKEITAVTEDTTYTLLEVRTPKNPLSLTVCDSTATYYNIPYKSDMNKNPTGTNQVYPASMLTALKDKTLWSMKLYARDDYTIDVKGLKIYLAEVDFTTFADKFAKAENGVVNLYDVSDKVIGSTFTATNFTAVKVFDHDYDFKQGENLIDFDTPYEYGGGNLLVIIENTDFGTNSNVMYFYAKNVGSNVSRYRYQRGNSYSTSYLAKCTFGYVDENYYTVTWKGTDGTTLETDTGMIFGEMPEYGGTLPEGTEDDFYTYTYEWDKEITAVTEDTTYTLLEVRTPKNPLSLTVCDGTNTINCIPYYGGFNSNTDVGSNQIYPSTMLNALTGKKLYSMTFYSSDNVEIDAHGLQVYLAEVNFTALPDTYAKAENGFINLYNVDSESHITSTFTATNFAAVKVYDADYDFGSGANVITFDEPYTYGGGNLLVIVQSTSTGTKDATKNFYGVYNQANGASRNKYYYTNASYAYTFLAKCTFGYLGKNKYTVTWKDADGNTLEIDENVIPGTAPEFNGTLTVPAGKSLCWSDGTNLYAADDDLPAVTDDVTYTAVFKQDPYTKDSEGITDGIILENIGDTIDTKDTSKNLIFDCHVLVDYNNNGNNQFDVYFGRGWTNVDSLYIDANNKFICYNDGATSKFTLDDGLSFKVSYDAAEDIWIIAAVDPGAQETSDVYTKNSEGIADGVVLKNPNDRILTLKTSQNLKFDCDVYCDYYNDGSDPYNIFSGQTWTTVESFFINDNNEFICYNERETSKFTPVNSEAFKVSYDADENMWHIADYADPSSTYTVTWMSEDGTAVLETDENVPGGTLPSFDSMDDITIPEGKALLWSNGIHTYRNGNLPIVARNVTYTAVLKTDIKLTVGAIFYAGDAIDFENKYFNSDDEDGGIEARNDVGASEIVDIQYNSGYGQYRIAVKGRSEPIWVTSENFGDNVGIRVKSGSGTENDPFIFTVFDNAKYTVTWLDPDGETVLEEDNDVLRGSTPEFNSMDKLTIPEGEELYWTDGTNKYAPDDLPDVTGNVTYTAVINTVKKLVIGTVFYAGDEIDFENKYFISDDYDGSISTSNSVGTGEIERIEYSSMYNQYRIAVKGRDSGIWFTYENEGNDVGVLVKSGRGTEDDPFVFTVCLDTTHTVTWLDPDGETVLEGDENVRFGTVPKFNSMNKLTISENETLYWSDGTNTYLPENLPAVTDDVTYTAVIKAIKTLAVGTIFYPGDMIDFDYKYYNEDDAGGAIDLSNELGIAVIGEPDYGTNYGQYWIEDEYTKEGFYVTSDDLGTNIGIEVVAGDGTKDKPFLFKTIPESGVENSYKVVLVNNGAYSGDIYAESGETISVPDDPTNTLGENYVFDCWLDENGEPFDFDTPITSEMILTANWVAGTSHTVSLVAYGQTEPFYTYMVADGNTSTDYSNSYYTNLGNEYVFLGWATSDGTVFDFSQPITQDLTLYEKWIPVSEYDGILVTFKMYESVLMTQRYNEGDKIPELYGQFRVNGFIFGGWLDEDGEVFDLNTPVTRSMTLTAKLTKDPSFTGHYVTFMDDGKVYGITGVNDGQNIDFAPQRIPNHDGYTMVGWYYGDTDAGDVYPTEDIIVTAKWTLQDDIGARLAGHNLILGDDIGVNFYMELSTAIAGSDTAKMIFTIPDSGETSTVEMLVKDAESVEMNGKTYYIFPCHVAAKEMTSTIKAQIVDGDDEGIVFEYSVKQYADYVISHPDEYGDEAVALVKSMLCYGSAAQTLFNFNTDKPADADLGDYTPINVPDSFTECGLANVNAKANDAGLQLTNVSLVLESKTTLRLYFRRTDASSADELPDLVCGGISIAAQQKEGEGTDGEYYYDIKGFAPGETFEKKTANFVGGETFEICVGDYCNWAMTGGSAKLKATITALYNYDECAKTYEAAQGGSGN